MKPKTPAEFAADLAIMQAGITSRPQVAHVLRLRKEVFRANLEEAIASRPKAPRDDIDGYLGAFDGLLTSLIAEVFVCGVAYSRECEYEASQMALIKAVEAWAASPAGQQAAPEAEAVRRALAKYFA